VTYEVVHWIRGRIRLRIPRLAYDAKFAQRLGQELMTLPGLKEARVNAASASLVVLYHLEPSGANRQGGCRCSDQAILPAILECICLAADAEVAPVASPQAASPGVVGNGAALPGDAAINYLDRLGLPALGIALGAGTLAGLAIPGLVVGGVILAAALPIFKRTIQGIRDEKRLTVDFLDASAIVLLTAQASFLAPAIVIGIIEGSEIVRDWTARRSKQATLDLLLAQHRQVTVERDGRQLLLAWDAIETGDVLLLYPGDQIPVDGFVLAGQALVEQHHMTGNATPVTCTEGDVVLATTLLVEGHLRVQATRTGHATRAAAILALLDAAPRTDTRVSNYARKVGNGAVVPTLAIAATLWATTGSVARATGIVSLDLGTGMRVSSPIAVVRAQADAARQGILIRSGRALEMLTQVDTIVFDKTATLTEGRARVIEVYALDPRRAADDVLALAASAEQTLDHPIAQAIVRHAAARGIAPLPCTAWHYLAGQGVVAEIDGRAVHVGSHTLLTGAGIAIDPGWDVADAPGSALAAPVFVACDGELAGVIWCADTLRPESAGVIASLHAQNKATVMLSGDSSVVTQATAAHLAMVPEHVYGELLPQQKVALVQALRASGRTVAVVGDGINDAAAMAHADLSIALGSGTDLACATADIVLLNNDLRDLMAATEIAQHAMCLIQQNKWIVVAPNVAAIAYGVLAVMNPIAGVVINNGTALMAGLNSLRPLRRARNT
jgi:Cu2+-exporting ATPase